MWLKLAAFCEHGNVPSGDVRNKEFLEQMSDKNF
jgi:hypothetical protein